MQSKETKLVIILLAGIGVMAYWLNQSKKKALAKKRAECEVEFESSGPTGYTEEGFIKAKKEYVDACVKV